MLALQQYTILAISLIYESIFLSRLSMLRNCKWLVSLSVIALLWGEMQGNKDMESHIDVNQREGKAIKGDCCRYCFQKTHTLL